MNKKLKIDTIREGLRRFNRRAGVLKSDPYGLGLPLSHCSALVDIDRLGPLKSNELVRLLSLEKSSVSRLVASLEEKGLLKIEDDTEDQRLKVYSLTAAGQRAVAAINRVSNDYVESLFEYLDPEEQKLVAMAFEKLSTAVDRAHRQDRTHRGD